MYLTNLHRKENEIKIVRNTKQMAVSKYKPYQHVLNKYMDQYWSSLIISRLLLMILYLLK